VICELRTSDSLLANVRVLLSAKIRRLYDIANILTSLDLIRKVHVTEVRGRKPAFKYVGPNVEDIKEVEGMKLIIFLI